MGLRHERGASEFLFFLGEMPVSLPLFDDVDELRWRTDNGACIRAFFILEFRPSGVGRREIRRRLQSDGVAFQHLALSECRAEDDRTGWNDLGKTNHPEQLM